LVRESTVATPATRSGAASARLESASRRRLERIAPAVAALLAVAALARDGAAQGILDRYEFSAATLSQWRLPDKLNEISGLALTGDGRLLAVTDESAIVYELDTSEGRLVKAFALGEPTVRGDFEGIAWSAERVWLVTSEGVIYESAEGRDGERVAFQEHPTRLDERCEIEGLAYRAADAMLLIPCKKIKKKGGLAGLAIFAWSTSSRSLVPEQTLSLPSRDIAAALRTNRFNPSGIAIAEPDGHLLIVAARQHAVIELDATGKLVATRVLPLALHRQAEGIEILPSGDILITDEGGGHKARLAIYSRTGRK
jgi:uncharacterized protein YjiK